jgi:Cys-rich repeat protein
MKSFIAFVVAVVALSVAGCPPPDDAECASDSQCGSGQVCAAGSCVECDDNGDCEATEFCCKGECKAEADIANFCGCGTAEGGSAGAVCGDAIETSLCLVDGELANLANVSSGTCGCGCTVADGGPLCTPSAVAGEETKCTCANNEQCRGAAEDATGRPHVVSDTCTPDDSCVCFSLGTANVCDINSATPDCASAGGCRAFDTDVANCGSAGRVCNVAATGIEGTGTCLSGGCTCDVPGDCTGGVNVDSCAFAGPDGPLRCVCAGYTSGGVAASCPMELECVAGGCQFGAEIFATEEALRARLR